MPTIYVIQQVSTGLLYVGQTKDLPQRLRTHRRNFGKIKVIECVNAPDAIYQQLEQSYIYLYDSYKNGLNQNTGGGGYPVGKQFTDTHRQNISKAVSGENNGFFGKSHSPEHRQRIRESCKQTLANPEVRQRMSGSHKGKRHLPETIEKIRQTKLGKKRQPFSKQWRENLSKAGKGVPKTPEHNRKNSEGVKRYHAKRRERERRESGQLTLFD